MVAAAKCSLTNAESQVSQAARKAPDDMHKECRQQSDDWPFPGCGFGANLAQIVWHGRDLPPIAACVRRRFPNTATPRLYWLDWDLDRTPSGCESQREAPK